ncbi:hypothetical protein [uncultured Desulfovibrio sp.]|uniref:hypothetical protein n=1 Tax=uncultured Desulfovibrio sp. TaxID=167968 RepID=UPI00320915FA
MPVQRVNSAQGIGRWRVDETASVIPPREDGRPAGLGTRRCPFRLIRLSARLDALRTPEAEGTHD